MTQYSKRMVITHWLTLALLIVAWYFGHELDEARHEEGAKLIGYVVHALIGGTVLLLVLARLYFRNKDGVPAPMGNTLADKVAKGVHHLLYAVLVVLPASGIATAATSDVCKALRAWDASLLPKKFSGVFAHDVHETLVIVLIALVIMHVLGALMHQFIIKDGLMKRMSLRKPD